jgi:hypothetical protein
MCNTLYQDFCSKMVWHKDSRMYYAHPTSGERFYLRLLLAIVTGVTSFEDFRSFEDIQYPNFREACIARGLLDGENEWHQCLLDAGHMQTGHQLRHLFVTIHKDCAPADPRALWDSHWIHICNDLERHHADVLGEHPSPEHIQDYGLYLIDQLLTHSGKRLQDWNSMPQITGDWAARAGNPLFREQLQYNQEDQARLAEEHIARLNLGQQTSFEQISSAVTNTTGKTFFLHGPGGTGKTYLYNTLCYHLRSQGKIVLCIASSGIAALLLMGGRTSHSRFKIPILYL